MRLKHDGHDYLRWFYKPNKILKSVLYILRPVQGSLMEKKITNEGLKISINLNVCFEMNVNVRSYFVVP